MAGLAHAAVGPGGQATGSGEINVGWLILGTLAHHPPWWDHSLLMAVVWSVLFGLLASWLGGSRHRTRIGVVFGLMVFSHWVLDWITHPMTALAPTDVGLPIAFGKSPLIGLGLYRSITAVWITEIGGFLVGLAIYIVWRMRRKRPLPVGRPAQQRVFAIKSFRSPVILAGQ